ncbi:uncharacterized protein LY79DRAFT_571954 [Colletotrichum navitas]|uniref:Uncharacterized protein n=1 Tax=Colletotrichum navitas TaxID=681940 RepID=A0AAD8PKF6_9PEZI|nr:uncharacterized protein LY79DRAFT_571954 [Colletotrichum navitas]KAK1569413.1 hypothetical protein LY79DRAFT_571954 [Colletotrichum navitas]
MVPESLLSTSAGVTRPPRLPNFPSTEATESPRPDALRNLDHTSRPGCPGAQTSKPPTKHTRNKKITPQRELMR